MKNDGFPKTESVGSFLSDNSFWILDYGSQKGLGRLNWESQYNLGVTPIGFWFQFSQQNQLIDCRVVSASVAERSLARAT